VQSSETSPENLPQLSCTDLGQFHSGQPQGFVCPPAIPSPAHLQSLWQDVHLFIGFRQAKDSLFLPAKPMLYVSFLLASSQQ